MRTAGLRHGGSTADVLLVGPAAMSSPLVRIVTTLLIVAGAALVAVTGVIHLHLWALRDGYRRVPSIGPLFLAQGIGGLALAIGLAAGRRLALTACGVAFMAASIGGLWLSVWRGFFGYHETMNAPFAGAALGVEIAGLVVLTAASVALLEARRPGGSS